MRNENWRPLALILAAIAVVLVVVFRLMPYGIRGANFVPVGAMFLFVAARLRPGLWYLLPFATSAGLDLYFYAEKSWSFPLWNYACYAIYLAIGWSMLRKSASPSRLGIAALAGSLQFFLITNFAVWMSHMAHPELYVGAPFQYPPTLAGLMECYTAGLPFCRSTFVSDLIFTGAFRR